MVFGQVADAAAHGGAAGRLIEQAGPAIAGGGDAEQDLDERGLAGAVLTEQAEDVAALDVERDTRPGPDAAVVLDQIVGLNDGHDTPRPFVEEQRLA